MSNRLRKRMLVTEGDLMQLWFEVEQVRNHEKKEAFKNSFKSILNQAQSVKLIPTKPIKQTH